MDPPVGYIRNPGEPYEATSLITAISVFLPLAVITTGIRVYMRTTVAGGLAKDDYLMVGSVFFAAVVMGLSLDNYGLGKHFWNLPVEPDLYPNWLMRNVLAASILNFSTALAKGSILLFYLRIFTTRGMRRAVWSVFTYTMCYSFVGACVTMFACQPIEASWNFQASLTAKCVNLPVWYFVSAGLNISCDIATLLLPLPKLRSLQMPRKQKIGVALILTMGTFVCVIAIIRLSSLYALLADKDLTRNTVTALMWCVLEINLQIIGGNIPTLKPFIQRIFPQLIATSRRHDTDGLIQLDARASNGNTGHKDGAFERCLLNRPSTNGVLIEDGSQENIVGGMGIFKTVQIGVEYEEQSGPCRI
ncbi:hypothetical protein TruAng_006497 [Truncatella angustata]|nr:hypothetical protein TruAng_006497 [Truncatella angustata]